MAFTLYENVKPSSLVNPVVITATTNSASLDNQGFGTSSIHFNLGTSADVLSGALLWTLSLEDSPDDAVWTAVTNATHLDIVLTNNKLETVLVGTTVVVDLAGEDDTLYSAEYRGCQRYVRGVITATGVHASGTPISITGDQELASTMPVIGIDS